MFLATGPVIQGIRARNVFFLSHHPRTFLLQRIQAGFVRLPFVEVRHLLLQPVVLLLQKSTTRPAVTIGVHSGMFDCAMACSSRFGFSWVAC